jgi:DNA repair exonuclease SbcCD ATPase subunit
VIENETRIVINTKKHYDTMYELLSNGDAGFKKFFINKILGIFNERINMYLPYFFNQEIGIVFDKNLNESIVFDGHNIEFSTFSSGQKTRVELAIALSLFIMVKTFFATNISFLVFDEILDKNLDVEGLNAVNVILTEMAKANTIFVMSHNEVLKDKFSEVISVVKKGKFSYVV